MRGGIIFQVPLHPAMVGRHPGLGLGLLPLSVDQQVRDGVKMRKKKAALVRFLRCQIEKMSVVVGFSGCVGYQGVGGREP